MGELTCLPDPAQSGMCPLLKSSAFAGALPRSDAFTTLHCICGVLCQVLSSITGGSCFSHKEREADQVCTSNVCERVLPGVPHRPNKRNNFLGQICVRGRARLPGRCEAAAARARLVSTSRRSCLCIVARVDLNVSTL